MGLSGGLAANGGGHDTTTLAANTDVTVSSPTDGQQLIYVGGTAQWTNEKPTNQVATGPGSPGVAGGNSGAAISIPNPGGSAGFGQYWATLTANAVTITMPSPAVQGTRFVMRLTQDSTGGRVPSFAVSPAVVFPGVALNVNTAAFADNWIAFECSVDNSSNPTWYGFPATSSVANLSDVADPDAARQNLRVQILRSAIRGMTTNVASLSGLQTLDGHTFVDGERIALFGQTTGKDDGLWVTHSGAWTRPTDYPTGASFHSRLVSVDGGTLANSLWSFNSDTAITVGTDATTWVRIDAGAVPAGGSTAQVATFTSTNATWPIPAGATKLNIRAVGGGGAGGSGGSTGTNGQLQSGSGAGGAGAQVSRVFAVSSSTHLNVTIGTGGTGAAGGAAGGANGTIGPSGGSTTVVGDGGDGITVTAPGGAGGQRSTASSTSAVGGGIRGGAATAAAGSAISATGNASTTGGGGASLTAGAAGGANGTIGPSGGSTTVVGDGGDGITVTAPGGAGGQRSTASSTSAVGGGIRGGAATAAAGSAISATGNASTTGGGGASLTAGAGQATGGPPDGLSGGGGGGGGTASATAGGNGGGAGTNAAAGAAGTGNTGSAAGANGANAAANTGAGGGGGGGGADNGGVTGAGGNGGNGGSGYVEVEVYFN